MANFRKKVFGWITPTKRFVECDMFDHVKVAEKDLEMKSIPAITELLVELEEIENDCQRVTEKCGAHNAEWHVYEIASDKARSKMIKILYQNQYVRVGTFEGNLENIMCFEGWNDVLKKRKKEFEEFAKDFNMSAKFEPLKRIT